MTAPSPATLETCPLSQLYRALGLMMCDRMLFAFDPQVETELDAKIEAIERELARRGVPSR